MKPRFKILIFDGTLKTTSFINRLIKGLASHHDIYVVGFDTKVTEKIKGVTYVSVGSASASIQLVLRSMLFACKALFLKGNSSTFFKIVTALFQFNKKKLQEYNFQTAVALLQPDIIHVQWPSLLPWVERYLGMKTPKIILSQRGYQNNVRPFVDPVNLAYLTYVYPKIDGFHSVSEAMRIQGTKIYSHANKIDRVVYTGFNFESIAFQKSYFKDTPLKIISIGRPHWKKGYEHAIKAMWELKRKGFYFTYEIIGGAGNEELTYLIQQYKLTTEVVLLHRISQKEVYHKMSTATLFLLPSLEEGLPNVMVEAMAMGVPVIATDCGGVSELLDETTGTLIPTRSAPSITEAVLTFAETSLDVIHARRLEARKRVEAKHSEEQMVRGMEALYVEVLGVD